MPSRMLVVSADMSVADLFSREAIDPRLVHEGRVFVGRRRVTSLDERVQPGETLSWHDGPLPETEATLLFADADIVVADKPAGIPTIPDQAGASHALLHVVARALGMKAESLHATSRLDRHVSGVVVFARSQKAERMLREARASGTYARRYVALARGSLASSSGRWSWPIGKARNPKLRAVNGRDATHAETRFAEMAHARETLLLALSPETGRTHQLRVHASHAGAPLLGDRDYGGATRLTLPSGRVIQLSRVALHAAKVTIDLDGVRTFVSPVPPTLRAWWTELGGEDDAWERAVAL